MQPVQSRAAACLKIRLVPHAAKLRQTPVQGNPGIRCPNRLPAQLLIMRKICDSMLKPMSLFQSLLGLFVDIGRASGRKLFQSLILAACATVAYAVIHVDSQNTFWSNLRVAFLENETERQERQRLYEQSMMQAELRQFAAANKLIDQLLQSMLERAPGASRVRLNVIHN